MPYRRLLVGTDFSGASSAAAAHAATLAAPGARVDVVHVRRVAPPSLVGPPSIEDTVRERDALARRLGEWAARHALEGARTSIVSGSPAPELAREAERTGADVVVVAATGAGSALRKRVLGSTARSVARAAHVDVLVARGSPPHDGPLHVLVATDFEPPAEEAARRVEALVGGRAGARVTLAHVLDADVWRGGPGRSVGGPLVGADAAREAAARALREVDQRLLGGRAEEVVRAGRPADELAGLAGERRADLVVVGTHSAGRLERALLGSVAEDVVEQAPCSVLVAKARAAAR